MDEVIKLSEVSKIYRLFSSKKDRMLEALHPFKKKYHQEFRALDKIDLSVKKGEILGIVGMNGSGKSSILKLIAGITQPSSGTIKVTGSVVALIELGAGFNPEFTGMQNIYFFNSIMGHGRKETDRIVDKIIEFAEIGDFIHQPLKTYSSGMMARLSFAVSVNINPDILIVDEILSVGDELFRRKSFSKMEEFIKAGKTILFVSHSQVQINQICTRAIMLHKGKIVLEGPPKFVTMNYDKFIFSKPDQQSKMLEEGFVCEEENIERVNDELGKLSEEFSASNSSLIEIPMGESYYLPGFLTKSAVITSVANLTVSEFSIKNLTGERINVLARNEEFVFSYHIVIQEDIGFLNFGIGVKNASGVVLSWKVFPGKMKYTDTCFNNGDRVVVEWRFKCKFMPGTYFFNTGIRNEVEGIERLVYKAADIFAFKVVEGNSAQEGGLFDISLSGSFKKI